MTIWRMRIACWIPKATQTLAICNSYRSSTATMVAWTRLDVTLNIHCLPCLNHANNLSIRSVICQSECRNLWTVYYGWLRAAFISYVQKLFVQADTPNIIELLYFTYTENENATCLVRPVHTRTWKLHQIQVEVDTRKYVGRYSKADNYRISFTFHCLYFNRNNEVCANDLMLKPFSNVS